METTPQPTHPTWEHRLQAVLALLGGEPVPAVTARCDRLPNVEREAREQPSRASFFALPGCP